MAQFQEMMRQQLESSMHTELEKLLGTSTGAEKEVQSYELSVSLPLFLLDHLDVITGWLGHSRTLGKHKSDTY